MSAPPRRPRQNQPIRINMAPPVMYYCSRHDYAYYDTGWTDPNSGIYYQPGYYDEAGNYYNNISIRQNGSSQVKTTCVCAYCGSQINVEWEPGQPSVCPNCGAPIEAQLSGVESDTVIPDEKSSYGSYSSYSAPERKKRSGWKIALIVIAVLVVIGLLFPQKDKKREPDAGREGTNEIVQKYYVSVLDRECPYVEEYEAFYDKETDCYFVLNDYLEEPVWQYWYEGISSDFGDFGWMEYDEDEKQWYIEQGEADWIVLPDRYDASALWHMEE